MTWLKPEDARLEDLLEVLEDHTDPADYPFAEEIVQEVPLYDAARLRKEDPLEVQASWPARSMRGPASSC